MFHAKAVNIARRWSCQNENDLVQENLYDTEDVSPPDVWHSPKPDPRRSQLHENAVNLARRWSVQNENDLLQEDLSDNSLDSHVVYTKDYCAKLSQHLIHYSALPVECRQYKDVALDLKRRDSDTTHGTQILS